MALDACSFYDSYWTARDRSRAEPRSRERARAALELLARDGLRAGKLLDFGCGPGWALEDFRLSGFQAMGLDASSRAVDEARARGLDARLLSLAVDLEHALPADAVDLEAIVALEVLEHLVDPLATLECLARRLAPRGRIVLSLPNEIALPARLGILLGRLPFGGHDDPHVRHFDRRGALRLFDAAGLQALAEIPISIVPPRWRALRAVLWPAARLLPGLFCLSTVHLLARRAPVGGGEAHGS